MDCGDGAGGTVRAHSGSRPVECQPEGRYGCAIRTFRTRYRLRSHKRIRYHHFKLEKMGSFSHASCRTGSGEHVHTQDL